MLNLINGDCLAELPKIKSKSIDFVFLDLPYGQTAVKWDKKIDMKELWKQLKRIAKNDRTPFFFTTTTKFGYELIKSNEKWFRWDLVWEKNIAVGFLNAYRLPLRKHEMIYCFSKKSPNYYVREHHKEKVIKPHQRNVSHSAGELYGFDAKDKTDHTTHKERLPTSMLKYCQDYKTGHRTAKPVKLMEFLLKYWTKEGDTILDPTAGSGSMGLACKNMNRNFIGIEMNEEIFELMKKRLSYDSI